MLLKAWSAPPGELFTQATALGGGEFILLSGVGGRSAHWIRLSPNGECRNSYGSLPPLNSLSSSATLFAFDKDPFTDPSALLRRTIAMRDWTTRATFTGTGWMISNRSDGGASAGLVGAAQLPLSSSSAGGPVLLQNQYLPAVSIASLSHRTGTQTCAVSFNPPAGTYRQPGDGSFKVTLASSDGPDSPIYYRLSPANAWQRYTTPISLSASATLFAYAENSARPPIGAPSPVGAAAYELVDHLPGASPPALSRATDADGNGLGDDWENIFQQHDPTADPDQDGANNLAEYLAGTDPGKPGTSAASSTPMELHYQVVTRPPGRQFMELSWTATDAVLFFSKDLLTWEPIPSGIVVTPAGRTFLVPLDSPLCACFFRLQR